MKEDIKAYNTIQIKVTWISEEGPPKEIGKILSKHAFITEEFLKDARTGPENIATILFQKVFREVWENRHKSKAEFYKKWEEI